MREWVEVICHSGLCFIDTREIAAIVTHERGADIHMKSGTIFQTDEVHKVAELLR